MIKALQNIKSCVSDGGLCILLEVNHFIATAIGRHSEFKNGYSRKLKSIVDLQHSIQDQFQAMTMSPSTWVVTLFKTVLIEPTGFKTAGR